MGQDREAIDGPLFVFVMKRSMAGYPDGGPALAEGELVPPYGRNPGRTTS